MTAVAEAVMSHVSLFQSEEMQFAHYGSCVDHVEADKADTP